MFCLGSPCNQKNCPTNISTVVNDILCKQTNIILYTFPMSNCAEKGNEWKVCVEYHQCWADLYWKEKLSLLIMLNLEILGTFLSIPSRESLRNVWSCLLSPNVFCGVLVFFFMHFDNARMKSYSFVMPLHWLEGLTEMGASDFLRGVCWKKIQSFLIFPLHPCNVANDFNHIWFWEEFSLRMPRFWPNIVSFAPPSLEVGCKFWDTDSQIVFMSWKGHFARCSGPGYICSLTAFWQCLVKIWGKFSIFRNWYYNDSNGCLSGPYSINVDRPCSRAFQYSFLF